MPCEMEVDGLTLLFPSSLILVLTGAGVKVDRYHGTQIKGGTDGCVTAWSETSKHTCKEARGGFNPSYAGSLATFKIEEVAKQPFKTL